MLAHNTVVFICPNPLLAGGHPSYVFAIHSGGSAAA